MAIKYEEDLKMGNTALKDDFEGVLSAVEDFVLKIA